MAEKDRRVGEIVAYIKIADFGPEALLETQAALDAFFGLPNPEDTKLVGAAGTDVPGALILDLRDNPGGLVEGAAGVASLLLPPASDIATLCTRNDGVEDDSKDTAQPCPRGTQARVLQSGPKSRLLPRGTRLAVLVNSGTKSSAEILAAAIQDLDAGIIVGSETFGKASGQKIFRVGSSGDLLKVSTTRFLAPSGRCIQRGENANLKATVQASMWRTAAGRPVLSGVGVQPDLPEAGEGRESLQLDRGAGGERSAIDVLARTGAFFDFAGDWARLHPDIAQRYAGNQAKTGEGSALIGGDNGAALVEAVEQGLGEAFERWAETNRLGPRGSLEDEREDLRRDPRLVMLAEELRQQGRNTAATMLEESVQAAEWTDLRRQLRVERVAAEWRAREAVLSRFLPTSIRLQAAGPRDSVLQAALRALRSPQYDQLLAPSKLSPLIDNANGAKQPEMRTKSYSRLMMENKAECLIGQICDDKEYVYIRVF